jgi:AcrR family transcriptional regulator
MSAAPLLATPPGRAERSGGNVKATREDWLDGGLAALATEGVARVAVLTLSERLGVSRSSFYWYFRDRADLLDALLARWAALNTRSILNQAAAPASSINEAVCNVFRCWVNPAIFSPRLDFAVREWARASKPVREGLDDADTLRTRAILTMFERFGYGPDDALIRARTLYYLQIGYYALDIREPLAERLALTPHYLRTITGVEPEEAEMAGLRAYALAHQGQRDFGGRA